MSYNFFKLCKLKYYNNLNIDNFCDGEMIGIGEPDKFRKKGVSIFGIVFGKKNQIFLETRPKKLFHWSTEKSSSIFTSKSHNGSWFALSYPAFSPTLESFFCFGDVSEGISVIQSIRKSIKSVKEYSKLVRIKHIFLLSDPFTDFFQVENPLSSPNIVHLSSKIIPRQQSFSKNQTEINYAKSESIILEILGDIPTHDIKPPNNVLFICKLNQMTTEKDLNLVLSQYGDICSCEIISDLKTGESLSYGFVGFNSVAACEEAYFKMNNLIIDNRRIKVDFSQSVAKLWKAHRLALRRKILHEDKINQKSLTQIMS
eukprot:gnl/MRDRNA2_/MRDRNA2_84929_c0_seq1.p1 gnl/MRDRNA2_/MRDRNA2_84929_c0~~gnl/MRDRNA2_/MRDRNA2_84929_c0_seq1.p1  ORF type:complete len:342 (+),score=-6.96 gnl/MRDRNA2_/MRDRNA2_84929_c0_seq1:87-1028(+)